MVTVTPLGTVIGARPIRESLQTTVSRERLAELLPAAERNACTRCANIFQQLFNKNGFEAVDMDGRVVDERSRFMKYGSMTRSVGGRTK